MRPLSYPVSKPPQTTTKNVIGRRVRQARQRPSLHLSQLGLSDRLTSAGLSLGRTAVSKIESGERHVMDYELIGLAKCLQVTTAWLLGETVFYQSYPKRRRGS